MIVKIFQDITKLTQILFSSTVQLTLPAGGCPAAVGGEGGHQVVAVVALLLLQLLLELLLQALQHLS